MGAKNTTNIGPCGCCGGDDYPGGDVVRCNKPSTIPNKFVLIATVIRSGRACCTSYGVPIKWEPMTTTVTLDLPLTYSDPVEGNYTYGYAEKTQLTGRGFGHPGGDPCENPNSDKEENTYLFGTVLIGCSVPGTATALINVAAITNGAETVSINVSVPLPASLSFTEAVTKDWPANHSDGQCGADASDTATVILSVRPG